jgi:hypothetical protein
LSSYRSLLLRENVNGPSYKNTKVTALKSYLRYKLSFVNVRCFSLVPKTQPARTVLEVAPPERSLQVQQDSVYVLTPIQTFAESRNSTAGTVSETGVNRYQQYDGRFRTGFQPGVGHWSCPLAFLRKTVTRSSCISDRDRLNFGSESIQPGSPVAGGWGTCFRGGPAVPPEVVAEMDGFRSLFEWKAERSIVDVRTFDLVVADRQEVV